MSQVRTVQPTRSDEAPRTELVPDPVVTPLVPGAQTLQPLQPLPPETSRPGAADAVVRGGGPPVTARDIPTMMRPSQAEIEAEREARGPIFKGSMPKRDLVDAVGKLASCGFTPEAQAMFARDMKRANIGDAAFALRSVRDILPSNVWSADKIDDYLKQHDTLPEGVCSRELLDHYFTQHGLRVDSTTPLDELTHTATLDRFRQSVRKLVSPDGPTKLTLPSARRLLAQIGHVRDLDDLRFAKWQIDRRVIAGQLQLDPAAKAYIDKAFKDRLDVKVNNNEVAFAARNMRLAMNELPGTDARDKAIAKAKGTFDGVVRRALNDRASTDAVFYADRAMNRELGKVHTAEADDVSTQLSQSIASRIGDRLDRYSAYRDIDAMLKSGEIDQTQAGAMRAGVAMSYTKGELKFAYRELERHLGVKLLAVATMVLELQDEVFENLEKSWQEQIAADAEAAKQQEKRLNVQHLGELGAAASRAAADKGIESVVASIDNQIGTAPSGSEEDARLRSLAGAAHSARQAAASARGLRV